MSANTIVRNATREDVSWLIETCFEFAESIKDKYLVADVPTLVELLLILMEKHLLLVCEIEEKKAGMLGAFIVPHYFNKNLTMATEVFWWVIPEYRKSGAGEFLLDEFVKRAKEKAQLIFVGSLISSGIDKFYEKKGFKMKEKSFGMEI